MSVSGRRVALVYDAIFPYVKGGGERRFYEIARLLAGDGYDVHLYGMKFWDGPSVRKHGKVTLHGLCKARPLYTKSGRRSISQPIIFGISCFKLFGERFDVMDCCGFPYFSIFPCRLITWVRRKPLYATWHEVWGKKYWNEYLGRLGFMGYFWELLAIKQPDEFIAVSAETADKLRVLRSHRKVHVINNSIDISRILKIKPSNRLSDIIFAGRLADTKHIDVLIRAVALLTIVRQNIVCTIVGDGPERKKLESLSHKLKLERNVQFTGFFENHDEMLSHIKAGKVFVLPSSREGFGIVVVEANAAGLPVITVDEPDNLARKLITKDNGIVTRLRENDLADAILTALSNPISAEKCIQAAEKYDWNYTIRQLKEVFA